MRGLQTCEAHVSVCAVKLLRGAAIVLPIGRDDPQHASLRFIAFEGADGAGKTTQARLLAAHLRTLGQRGRRGARARRHAGRRERADAAAGQRRPASGRAPRRCCSQPRARSWWTTSSRPALARGATVIADRYVGSSLVYQGVVRGVGADAVRAINAIGTGGLLPGRDRAARRERRAGRRAARSRRRPTASSASRSSSTAA